MFTTTKKVRNFTFFNFTSYILLHCSFLISLFFTGVDKQEGEIFFRMKVTLAFLVLGMVMVAFAASEVNDEHQLSLDNDDDLEIPTKEYFVDEERSEEDVTGRYVCCHMVSET